MSNARLLANLISDGLDFEEGTWTPQITRATSNPSGTPSSSEAGGGYIKIGNMVHVRGKVAFNGFSGGSGQWRCSLPFTHLNSNLQKVSGLHKGRVYMDGDSSDRQFRIFAGNNFIDLIVPSTLDYYYSNTTFLIWEFSGTYLIQG